VHFDGERVTSVDLLPQAGDNVLDHVADVGARHVEPDHAGLEARDVQQVVRDANEPLGLRCDVAQERAALGFGEIHVAAEQGLGEAVDRRERRAELVRDGRHEI
jgi:hypothetical protein